MSSYLWIENRDHPLHLPLRVRYCVSLPCRLRGLMFRRRLSLEEGILLVGRRDSRFDSAIHMLFCFTDLAIVWINHAEEVVDVRLARQWWPAYVPRRPARYVLEVHPARLSEFHPGDHLAFYDA